MSGTGRECVTDAAASFAADADDRRAALAAAVGLTAARGDYAPNEWTSLADAAYRWLRERDTLRIVSVQIIPGTPYPEGTSPMTSTFDLSATSEDIFTLTGQDANGNPVPLPANYTASWTLSDPAGTGAVLTPSADMTSATLAPVLVGTVTINVAVTVTNSDGTTSTFQGAEAVIIAAGPINTIAVVPGTPTPEPAPTPPAAPAA
jgi:hypothetical protein